jgi:hypothetical protein
MKNVPNVMSGGYDHSGRFFEAMGYISCLGLIRFITVAKI